ncbi:MAG: uL15m family ribosomal protein [Methermicoccaceae archaeon]
MDTKKFRGSRTCGCGSHKKRRGAGSRGGRGKSGSHKRKFVHFLKLGYRKGKHGFTRPPDAVKPQTAINLQELQEFAEELANSGGTPEKILWYEEDTLCIDAGELGFDKVLGSGKLSRPMKVRAQQFSTKAALKIAEAGGETEVVK